MDKPKSYIEWHSSLEGFEGLRHANCCKISYEAGQQSRQAEIDQLKGLLEKDEYAHSLYYENLNLQTSIDEKDKRIEVLENRIEEGLGFIDKFHCEGWLSDLDNAEKALRGEHE